LYWCKILKADKKSAVPYLSTHFPSDEVSYLYGLNSRRWRLKQLSTSPFPNLNWVRNLIIIAGKWALAL
jgi:hypothetical protein